MKTIRRVFITLAILLGFSANALCKSEFDYLYKNLPFEMGKVKRPSIPFWQPCKAYRSPNDFEQGSQAVKP